MAKDKKNPRNIPRSQADVDKAYDRGLLEGLKLADLLILNALADKHGHEIDLVAIWGDFKKLQMEFAEGRIKLKDVEEMLKEEYGIDLDT